MPVNNQKFTSMTVDQRNSIPMLPNFVCDHCHKKKPTSLFSNKERTKYTSKIAAGVAVNEYSAKLVCRSCKGEPLQELKCGYCRIVKALDEFSKAQRKGGEGWCKECISWKEAQEPGLSTEPAPNGELAPDEDELLDENLEGYSDGGDGDDYYGYGANDGDDGFSGYGGYDDYQCYQSNKGNHATNNREDGVSIIQSQISKSIGQSVTGPNNATTLTHSLAGMNINRKQSSASNPYEDRLGVKTASVGSWSSVEPSAQKVPTKPLTGMSNNPAAEARNAQYTIANSAQSTPQPTNSKSAWAKPVVSHKRPFYEIKRPTQQRATDSDDEDDY